MRKNLLKKLRKESNKVELKQKYNKLSKLIKIEIKAIQENMWLNFCQNVTKSKPSSAEYWRKIKLITNLEKNPSTKKQMPELKLNGNSYKTAAEKADLFGQNLKKVFLEQPNSIFDEKHKIDVDRYINHNNRTLFVTKNDDESFDNEFSDIELEEVLKSLNKKSATGPDGVNNKHLTNLSALAKSVLLKILNISWRDSIVLQDWKISKMIMIQKDPNDTQDPNKYRPISVTNTIVKLLEKLVQKRLISFIEKHRLLIKNQSGFRKNRQTTDNIVYFCQKTAEAFDGNEKVCGVIFDIMKAFDKVWHNGLLFKLSKHGIPKRLGYWIQNFLSNRKFFVQIENHKSNLFDIQTGVPQGAILSPVLFALFINDIIECSAYPNHKIMSLLFADDLFAFNRDKNINRLRIQMQRYLNKLEKWLTKWRLNIAANKCSFTIYTKGKVPKELNCNSFNLKIFNENIPINHNPKYLGVTFNRNLNFTKHTEIIREKCLKLVNIIKCLTFKKWSLDNKLMLNVYKTLIRSKIEYAPQILLLNEKNIERLNGIQYKVL